MAEGGRFGFIRKSKRILYTNENNYNKDQGTKMKVCKCDYTGKVDVL